MLKSSANSAKATVDGKGRDRYLAAKWAEPRFGSSRIGKQHFGGGTGENASLKVLHAGAPSHHSARRAN
jgi:hypothetical protein